MKILTNWLLIAILLPIGLMGQEPLFGVFDDLDETSASSQGTSILSMLDVDDDWIMGTEWINQDDWGWDETTVFHAQLVHNSSDLDWSLGIGKGGQIYSWNVDGIGELVPPQERGQSAWIDDNIMYTLRASDVYDTEAYMNNKWYGNSFVHGSGLYIKPDKDSILTAPFYNPLLGESFSSSDRSYSIVNWGLIPEPSINRSDVLIYTNFRHLGDGVVEITYYFYNFGKDTYDDNTFPWATMRPSIFTDQVRPLNTGGYESFYGHDYATRYDIIDYGGWIAPTDSSTNGDGFTFGLVHGLDKYSDESWQNDLITCGSGFGRTGGDGRDAMIVTTRTQADVETGQGFFFRTYFVLGTLDHVEEKSEELKYNVDYDFVEFNESSTDLLPLYDSVSLGQNILTTTKPSSSSIPVASTYAIPVKNSVPLILMKDAESDEYYLSTDQYALCGKMDFVNSDYTDRYIYQPYDGKTEWIALLGYVMPLEDATVTENTATLASIIGDTYQFTAGEKQESSALLVRTDYTDSTTPPSTVGLYEAEDATIERASIKTDDDASGGEYVDGNDGFNLTFNVSESTGNATLTFRIKAPSGARSMGVYVNDSKVGTITTLLNTWNSKKITAILSSGSNSIELRDSEDTTEFDVDYLEVEVDGSTINTFTIQENETGFCGVDGTISNDNSGFTGDGFANTSNSLGEGVDWEINGSAGDYTFTWMYASSADRPADMMVDGSILSSNIAFAATGSWTSWTQQSITLTLSEGIKTIRLQSTTSSGLGNIDYMMVEGPDATVSGCTKSANSMLQTQIVDSDNVLAVYPNPVTGILNVELKTLESASFEILNSAGQTVRRGLISMDNNTVNLENLENGIYIFKVLTDQQVLVKKIIKE